MSARHEMRKNETFGRFDLIDHNHYTFARNSGLPLDHFKDDLAPARGIVNGLIISGVFWFVLWLVWS